MSESSYKWPTAHDWLHDRIQKLVLEKDATTLGQDFRQLADNTDADEIQDLFQSDMKKDGFFEQIEPNFRWKATYVILVDRLITGHGDIEVTAKDLYCAHNAAKEAVSEGHDVDRIAGVVRLVEVWQLAEVEGEEIEEEA